MGFNSGFKGLKRMWLQNNKEGTATASWLYKRNLTGPQTNPPPTRRNLHQLEYLQLYARDMAYIPPPDRDETTKAFKKTHLQYITYYGTGGRRH